MWNLRCLEASRSEATLVCKVSLLYTTSCLGRALPFYPESPVWVGFCSVLALITCNSFCKEEIPACYRTVFSLVHHICCWKKNNQRCLTQIQAKPESKFLWSPLLFFYLFNIFIYFCILTGWPFSLLLVLVPVKSALIELFIFKAPFEY